MSNTYLQSFATAMAASTSRRCCMNMARGMAVYMLVVVAVCASASRAIDICPSYTDTAVYPYWSLCYYPAVYSDEAYYVASGTTGLYLAPEWDETNSTYYIRLADEGASYVLSYLTREIRAYVALSEDVVVTNADTGRVLAWRNEGEDEYFLVEVESDDNSTVSLAFATSTSTLSLPCPLIYPPAQCLAYSILDYNSTSGLALYVEDDVTYFTKSATDLTSFLLKHTSFSSASLNKNMIASNV